MSLQSEIFAGLDRTGWDESVEAVKTTMANALRSLDKAVQITDTRYFNHSFVPDFVLSWPREPGRNRDVYLRLDTTLDSVASDLRYVTHDRPMFVGLTEVADDVSASSAVRGLMETSPALVSEPNAVEKLISSSSDTDFGRVVPAAVLRGGVGYVGRDAASRVSHAGSEFFSGAREHNASAVSQSAANLELNLDSRESNQLFNLGRIVWEAVGGNDLFPLATNLSGVDDTGLRFLLEEAPEGDSSFWRSAGRLVTLERLTSLGVHRSPNLTAFIRANADRLLARQMIVKAGQPRLDDEGAFWAVAGGGLALNGVDFTAYLAGRADDLTVATDSYPGLPLASFRERTKYEQVETVVIAAADGKKIMIQSDEMFDPETDEVLASVANLPGTRVASVGIIVDGKHLECDFTDLSASGRTSAQFDLLSMVRRALPMVWPLYDARDRDEVRLVDETVASLTVPPSLFDDNEDDDDVEVPS